MQAEFRIDPIALSVRDIAARAAFYDEWLGLKEIENRRGAPPSAGSPSTAPVRSI